ncbi:MAG: hypothetical protein ACRDKA_07250 [Actinomycetota bacterium]
MDGPAATIALVLAETAAGGTVLLWLGRVWGSVKRGFFVLTGSAALAAALLATLATASAAPDPAGEAARTAVALAGGASAVLGLSVAALVLRLDTVGWALGLLSIPATVAMLAGFAAAAPTGFVPAFLQLLAGAAFMGAVIDGLLLGHWYLTDRRLPRDHIRRYSVMLIVAVALEGITLAVLGFGSTDPAAVRGFSPLLGISGLTTWLALGMVACTALIAVLIRASLRGERARAVQAATGFFYLAVITALTAEMAAKVGFLA